MELHEFYFEPLNRIIFIYLEESYIDLYLNECYEYKPLLDTNIIVYDIIDIKYKR